MLTLNKSAIDEVCAPIDDERPRDDAEVILSDVEVETLRRAAVLRKMPFEPSKRAYKLSEIRQYGLVREAYNWAELEARGVTPIVVTSHDTSARTARSDWLVEAPFADRIEKWQLPIYMPPFRVLQAAFPPGSTVMPHVHPKNTEAIPGGSLRVVLSGSITFRGEVFRTGEWFFIPNGVPYSFTTDMVEETIILYKYSFFGAEEGNRFSHPHQV